VGAAAIIEQLFKSPQPMTSISNQFEESKGVEAPAVPVKPATGDAPAEVKSESEKLKFSCRKCRKVLFTEDHLEEHMSKVKAYNTRSHSIKVGKALQVIVFRK
jgi:hypothetical protein